MSSLSEVRTCSDKARCAAIVGFLAVFGLTACGGSTGTRPDKPIVDEKSEAVEPDVTEPVETPAVSKEACALQGHWPMFQREPGRSGESDAPAIQNPKVRWAARVGVQTWNNNPIVVGELVIVGSSGDVWNKPDKADGVYAFWSKTGELAWFAPFDNDVNGVALAGCRVLAGSDDGTFRGLDPLTGDEAWSEDFKSKVYGQPLPIPGGVIVTTQNSGIHKMDPVSGVTIWSAPVGEVRQGAAWDGDSLWVATTGGKMIRFSADGKLQWSGDVPGQYGVWGAPTVVIDGAVAGFVRDTTYGTPGLAGFRMSGAPMWDKLDRGARASWANVRTSPAYVDGKLYHAEAYSNDLVVTELATARVIDAIPLGSCMFPQWSSPVANSQHVIVARHDGGLYAISRENQEFAWGMYLGTKQSAGPITAEDLIDRTSRSCSWSADESSLFATPAIGPDGAVYVGSGAGWLFAIEED